LENIVWQFSNKLGKFRSSLPVSFLKAAFWLGLLAMTTTDQNYQRKQLIVAFWEKMFV